MWLAHYWVSSLWLVDRWGISLWLVDWGKTCLRLVDGLIWQVSNVRNVSSILGERWNWSILRYPLSKENTDPGTHPSNNIITPIRTYTPKQSSTRFAGPLEWPSYLALTTSHVPCFNGILRPGNLHFHWLEENRERKWAKSLLASKHVTLIDQCELVVLSRDFVAMGMKHFGHALCKSFVKVNKLRAVEYIEHWNQAINEKQNIFRVTH